MATCYICGKSHAEYRRSVYTGNSNRIGVSTRGNVHTSTTAHYGIRCVCAKCALDIDYNNKRNAGTWGIVLGSILGAISVFALFINPGVGIAGLALSLCIGVVPVQNAHEKAKKWYEENNHNYIDSYDLKQEIEQNQKNIKIIEQQNKHKDEFQALGKTFGNRIQQEMGILAAKGDLLNATFNNKVVHTVEECDNILKTLKTLESEVNTQTKELQALCNDYIKQCKKFDFGNEFMDNFLTSVEGVRSQCTNAINEFMNQLKLGEAQLLQAKATIIRSENS